MISRQLKIFAPNKEIIRPHANEVSEYNYTINYEFIQWYQNSYNKFPNQILEHYLKANIFSSIFDDLCGFLIGQGFETKNDDLKNYIQSVNNKSESLRYIFKQITKSKYLYGNAFVIVTWDDETNFINFYPQFAINCRIQTIENNNYLRVDTNGFETNVYTNYNNLPKIPQYPNYEVIEEDGFTWKRSYIHFKDNLDGFNTYTPPFWISGLSNSKTPYKIANWNLSRIEKGFNPSGYYTNHGISDDKTMKKVSDALNFNNIGEDNAGKIILVDGQGEFKFSDRVFDLDWGMFTKVSIEQIHITLRYPPSLMGEYGDKGFSKDKGMTDYALFKPFMFECQESLIEPLKKIIKEVTKIDTSDLKVINKNPFEIEKTKSEKHKENYAFYSLEQQAKVQNFLFEEVENN